MVTTILVRRQRDVFRPFTWEDMIRLIDIQHPALILEVERISFQEGRITLDTDSLPKRIEQNIRKCRWDIDQGAE